MVDFWADTAGLCSRGSRCWVNAARALAMSGLVVCFASVGVEGVLAQQSGTLTGQVTRQDTGEPLRGAQVSIQGTGLGALSGNDGRFVIENVPAGEHTVGASYLGYAPETQLITIIAGQAAAVQLSLRQRMIDVEALVVTGTAGQARRREVGHSVGQLRAQDFENAPITTVEEALSGRTAGVNITASSGQVGGASVIRVRGISTIAGGHQGNTPLIYVDGVRMSKSSPDLEGSGTGGFSQVNQGLSVLDDIRPEDIDRIEVIRGSAATTLYGTEAASGVIQIFTKSGSAGAAQWSYSTTVGVNALPWVGPDKSVNPAGLGIKRCNIRPEEDPVGGIWFDPSCPSSGAHDQLGFLQDYSLSVQGGAQDVRYFVSGYAGDEGGTIGDQGAQRWGLRANIGFSPSSTVDMQVNTSFGRRNITWVSDGNSSEGFTLNVFRAGQGYNPQNSNRELLDASLLTGTSHAVSSLNLTWRTLPGLTQQFKGGVDYFTSEFTQEWPFTFIGAPLGLRVNNTWAARTLSLDYAGTWQSDIGEGVSSSFSWGGQVFQEQISQVLGIGRDFAGPGLKVLDSGARTSSSEKQLQTIEGGAFLQQQFGFGDALFVTGGLRVDGNSRFGEDFGAQFYPKLSATYMISDAAFWPADWEMMKLRLAWGQSGRAPGPFDALRTYASVSGDDGQPGVTPGNLGSPGLGPERSSEIELGFEAGFLDDRVGLDFSYWTQSTVDALISLPPVPSQGFVQDQVLNIGQIDARGGELSGRFDVLRSPGLNWNISGHFSWNRNEAVDLGGVNFQIGAPWPEHAREGQPIPVIYGPRIQNPDAIGEVPIREAEAWGPSEPTRNFGLSTQVTFLRNFTAETLFEGEGGHYGWAGTQWAQVNRRVWPPCLETLRRIQQGDTADMTVSERVLCNPQEQRFTDPIFRRDWIRWRSLSLTYRIPQNLLPLGLSAARVRVAGQNLMLFTDWPDPDPETIEDGGSANTMNRTTYYQLPMPRRFTLHLSLTH